MSFIFLCTMKTRTCRFCLKTPICVSLICVFGADATLASLSFGSIPRFPCSLLSCTSPIHTFGLFSWLDSLWDTVYQPVCPLLKFLWAFKTHIFLIRPSWHFSVHYYTNHLLRYPPSLIRITLATLGWRKFSSALFFHVILFFSIFVTARTVWKYKFIYVFKSPV